MESLIKASENYQAIAKDEEINTELLNQFMNKITVWDYSWALCKFPKRRKRGYAL